MASIKYEHVWKRFGDFSALKDLNIDIADQEFLVLVGPSGCGKTTALRCLAGLEEITDGNIYIGDRVVNDVPPKDRDIAMVFQSYALYPHMSVYDNMAFGLKLRKTPKNEIDRRVKEAAEMLKIGHLLDRKPKALSGGQRQRVALGRAIVRNPAVFLMDEPLSNLDAKLRVDTRAEISKLHQRLKTTFIYVTHDQTEALTMGTRIAVMKDGVLQQLDTPQTLYDHPANMFVAGFIGSPSMNFFEGTLARGGGCRAVPPAGAAEQGRRRGRSHRAERLLRHPPGGHPRCQLCAARRGRGRAHDGQCHSCRAAGLGGVCLHRERRQGDGLAPRPAHGRQSRPADRGSG
jgi:multiple sugar transport system ATP-binding protein